MQGIVYIYISVAVFPSQNHPFQKPSIYIYISVCVYIMQCSRHFFSIIITSIIIIIYPCFYCSSIYVHFIIILSTDKKKSRVFCFIKYFSSSILSHCSHFSNIQFECQKPKQIFKLQVIFIQHLGCIKSHKNEGIYRTAMV